MAKHQRMVRIAVVTALVVLLLSGYWLQSRILHPLNRAIEGFQRVSQGDFGHQVRGLPHNEIGWMTTAFKELSQRIQTESTGWILFSIVFPTVLGMLLASAVYTTGVRCQFDALTMMASFWTIVLALLLILGLWPPKWRIPPRPRLAQDTGGA